MFGLKCKLKIDNTWTVESNHNIALICNYAFLSTLEKSLFLH